MEKPQLRIAIEGCCHGELNNIFKEVSRLHQQNPIDLLIILGDFQSLRSTADFCSISIPPKYQKLGDFHNYYNNDTWGPPVPTLFIGGNHESMRHLMLLPHGGYASKDIYYLGYSNMIWFKGVRIGSLSGIWKQWDLERSRTEWSQLERNRSWQKNVRSLYHVRKSDVIPLFMVREDVDLMLSHDWPNGVVYYGNMQQLLKYKPFFKQDIDKRELGSPISWQLLRELKPKWWLSAHLHVKFEALIKHTKRTLNLSDDADVRKNNDEIALNLSSDSEEDVPSTFQPENKDEIVLDLSSEEDTKQVQKPKKKNCLLYTSRCV